MILAKILHALNGLLNRLQQVEKRLLSAEQAIKQIRSRNGGATFAESYGFGLAPGSPAHGLAAELWCLIGDETAQAGVYEATPQLVSGTGQWTTHPDLGTILVWKPDLKPLQSGSRVLVRWEGRSQAGEDWYVVVSGAGSPGVHGELKSVASDGTGMVQPWDEDGNEQGEPVKVWVGIEPWHRVGDPVYCAVVSGDPQYCVIDKIRGAGLWTEPTVPSGGITGDSSNTLHSKQDAPNSRPWYS